MASLLSSIAPISAASASRSCGGTLEALLGLAGGTARRFGVLVLVIVGPCLAREQWGRRGWSARQALARRAPSRLAQALKDQRGELERVRPGVVVQGGELVASPRRFQGGNCLSSSPVIVF